MSAQVEAFGKVFLAGEYAVLDGGPAVIAGVDRRLHASWQPAPSVQVVHAGALWDGGAPPPELRFAAAGVEEALRFCGTRRGFRLEYQDDFSFEGVKLGLGGSAAATVIAVRAACAAQGREVSDAEVLSLARAAHLAAQGGAGSGADVAASVLGGVLQFRPGAEPKRIRTPGDLRMLLAFTGQSADTRALVREARRFMDGDRPRWAAVKAAIVQASESLASALEAGERDRALEAVRAGAAAMARLGAEAKLPVVTQQLAQACALAAASGAAGKPSGAGGGDCAVILAFGDEARDRAEVSLRKYFPVFRVAPA